MMLYLKNIVGFKMDYFKGMTYDDIRPIFEKHFDSNVAFLLKTKEQMDEEDSRALKRLNESQEEKAAKKQKLNKEMLNNVRLKVEEESRVSLELLREVDENKGEKTIGASSILKGWGRGRGREDMKKYENQWSPYRRSRGRGFQSQKGGKPQIQCYNCLNYGHYANECTSSIQVEEKVNVVEVEDKDKLSLLMAKHNKQEKRTDPWHIDSAASNHVTGEEDLFVEMEKSKAKCLKSRLKDHSWLWHMRYVHLNFGDLKLLSLKGMVKWSDQIDHPNQVCEGCLLEKHAWSSFSKEATSRANEPLQLIHTDLYGPITPPSHGKNLYFMLSINDYSRKTLLYFQEERFQAFEAFKKFKDVVEKEEGTKD
uniref:Copia-type polyprotein n=1 Tax=Tanacetum cinerariifolium TaxID=118510 RepID=A0A699GYK9_TANCI|nr:copia-type polyprotein [Tanacetum cinerariifolium]